MSNPAVPTDRRALLQHALQSLDEMQAKLDAVEEARTEPIAIVGMSCRFPGGADSLEAYWELLCEGVDAVGELSQERQALVGGMDDLAGTSALKGGFLSDIDQFDPQFFGISPREATSMDPQQRLVLETSWEALERAGIAPDSLNGSLTGVFVGITTNDYGQLLRRDSSALDVYAATGSALNAAPGRVAYTLGLRGPSVAVDTACSSSLVAVHLAVQSLRNRECDMALAGGVNVTLLPEAFACFTAWGMLAPDGRCKAFDAAADGFVRGEGCGMVALKRQSDALADGDRILALVRGSAVNQDGRSAGLTVPNGTSQRAVIQVALRNARVDPAQVQYVEAHGTGTTLGDPIEIEAIGGALGAGRGPDTPLHLGSVKTNLGHLESAAGIAGLIKVVLMLQHGQIPPHLHFHQPSPDVPWPSFPIEISTSLTSWPDTDGPRLAGVSGFGLSGTNAHVVLESAPEPRPSTETESLPRHPLVLSARTEAALRSLAGHYAAHFEAHPDLKLADVAATTSQGRAHLPHRLALAPASIGEAAAALAAYAAGETGSGLVTGQAPLTSKPRPVVLFTGQGSQYAGMGRDLYAHSPVYRAALDRCAALLAPHLDRPLLEVLFAAPDTAEAALLDQTHYTQPALFAVEYALAALWQSWGIRPSAVAGHSLGEYVAACVAGVLSLEDALRLVAVRGRLMGSLPAGGAMAAIMAPVEPVRAAIERYGAALAIAAINGPAHTVISGEAGAVAAVSEVMVDAGIRVRPLTVSHAFHSALMDPVLDEFEAVARDVRFHAPQVPLVSNLTGEVWAEGIAPDASYWRRHLREAVQFAPSITSLREDGFELFLEIGPHPVLSGMGQECIADGSGTWLASMRRGRDEWVTVLDALGKLYVAGADIDWKGVTGDYAGRHVDLPTYPFQRQRYWTAASRSKAELDPHQHPLLGRRLRSPLIPSTIYESQVSVERPAYLGDHVIYDMAIFPGSAFVEMALAAVADTSPGAANLKHLELSAPLVLPSDGAERIIQLMLTPDGSRRYAFQIASFDPEDVDLERAVTHASGVVGTLAPVALPEAIDTRSLVETFSEEIEVDGYYARLMNVGLDYGVSFRGLMRLFRGDSRAAGLVRLPEGIERNAKYRIHPAQLDACFHVIGAAMPDDAQDDGAPFIPLEINGLRVFGDVPAEVWCTVEISQSAVDSADSLDVRLGLYSGDGEPVAEIDRLVLKRVPRAAWSHVAVDVHRDWFYRQVWQPAPVAQPDELPEPGTWLVFADESGISEGLARRLGEPGGGAITVVSTCGEHPGDGHFVVDPADPDALRQLLTKLDQPLEGIAYLWGMDGADDLLTDYRLQGALHLAQALADASGPHPRLWLVTSGAVAVDGQPTPVDALSASLWGFGRTLAVEHPLLNCTCLDLDPSAPADVDRLVETLLLAGDENQIAVRGTQRYVPRLEREVGNASSVSAGPYQLQLVERGNLDNLTLVASERRAPGPGEVEVAVRASGLNFRDVLNVLGMYPGDPGPPGTECAGTVLAVGPGVDHIQPGDEVVALGVGCFDSHLITRAELVFPKPRALSFVEAAAVPSAYLAAAYGLIHLAELQPGERVLIHAAAGGVGLAAVHIALSRGAEVFATAGSPGKRAYLAGLGVRYIYNSRTLDFADEIIIDTGGAGVDVVLNSLTEDFITRSFAVLAPDGRFLELGKRGVWSAEDVAAIRPNAAYHVYDLSEVLQSQPGLLEGLLRDLLEAIAEERLTLVPVRAFPATSIVDAFRFMAQARHIGKVVITHRPAEAHGVRPGCSYLITGGTGGLGLATARWLVERGAGAIALIARSEPSETAREQIAELERAGARVLVLRGDVSHAADVSAALAAIDREFPSLKGVFHAAGTTDDGELGQQTWQRFVGVLAPKATGALHLDRLTRDFDLDHFVLFSSASSVLGSPGQSNYTAANAVLDGLAQARSEAGLPALSINWGAWDGVGMAARLDDANRQRLSQLGMGTISPDLGMIAMESALGLDHPNLVIMPVRWDVLARQVAPDQAPPILRNMLSALETTGLSGRASIAQRLDEASPGERLELVTKFLCEAVSSVAGLPASQVDANQPLTELGLDSLMAVEVRNGIASALGVALSPVDILAGASAADLAGQVLELMSTGDLRARDEVGQLNGDPGPSEAAELLAGLNDLSDDQIDALLKELAMEDERDDASGLKVGRARS